MNSLLYRIFKHSILSFMVVSMTLFNIPVSFAADSAVLKDSDPVLVEISDVSSVKGNPETEPQTALTVDGTDPHVEGTGSIDGLTMLYMGGAAAGVAVLALALGGSSSSSDSSVPPVVPPVPELPDPDPDPEPDPDPDPDIPDLPDVPSGTDPVGPDLNGSDWTGFLDINDSGHKGFQAISAKIKHNGSSVQIYTSSTLDYGRKFSGTISSSGYMLMYDSISGEDWTTHKGNATKNRVDLYDYVNWFEDLDRMKLTR